MDIAGLEPTTSSAANDSFSQIRGKEARLFRNSQKPRRVVGALASAVDVGDIPRECGQHTSVIRRSSSRWT